MNNYKGLFATFEGLDFSGKSTQANILRDYLVSLGISVIYHREPGGTRIGEKIRELLSDKDNKEMSKQTELMLFNASRSQLVQQALIPALQRGDVFLSDRFYDSSTAYQGYGRGLSLEGINVINNVVSQGISPDLTFLVDITLEEMYRRKKVALLSDRIESSGYQFYQRVKKGYLEMARNESLRIKVIDGMRTIEECSQEIKKYFDEVFELKFSKALNN